MPAPSTDPIEIQIRDAFATLATAAWKPANGYYFTLGDVNQFDEAQVVTFPRLLIFSRGEANTDETRAVNAGLFHNRMIFTFDLMFKDSSVVDTARAHKEAAKLADDLKKFIGANPQIGSAGAFMVLYQGHEKVFSNDGIVPGGISAQIVVGYRQRRDNPAAWG